MVTPGKVCSSCGRLTDQYVEFKCPSCGKGHIVRDYRCRENFVKYTCKECGFEGP
ncbi:MAG: RNA-binding protein [Candidatus Micrarchaeota archaeon]|nr:RNA-binding protein [Candidatus Micrarchaeota archaeon]